MLLSVGGIGMHYSTQSVMRHYKTLALAVTHISSMRQIPPGARSLPCCLRSRNMYGTNLLKDISKTSLVAVNIAYLPKRLTDGKVDASHHEVDETWVLLDRSRWRGAALVIVARTALRPRSITERSR